MRGRAATQASGYHVDLFGATATSTGRDVIICWILRMLLLTTLLSWSRRRRETGLFGVVATDVSI